MVKGIFKIEAIRITNVQAQGKFPPGKIEETVKVRVADVDCEGVNDEIDQAWQ